MFYSSFSSEIICKKDTPFKIMWMTYSFLITIKIAGRNINNLRDADDTTLMAESEEELRSLLMRVKQKNEKTGLKLHY